MGAYVSLFGTLEDAHAFERAALAVAAPFLPPCARVVRDGGTPTELYWRWLAIQAEVWS